MSDLDPTETTDDIASTTSADELVSYETYDESVSTYEDTTSYEESSTTYEDTTSYDTPTYDASTYDASSTYVETNYVDPATVDPASAGDSDFGTTTWASAPSYGEPVMTVDELVTEPAAPATTDTGQMPYDAFTTQDLHAWETEYAEWSTAVTTTGQVPTTDADGIIGEPFEDAGFWFQQNTQFTCGPSVATQIISDFTGNVQLNETELANYAEARGWMVDEDGDGDYDGMYTENIAQLLTDHGVPSHVEVNQDVDDLVQYLSEGRSVVLSLDNENLPGMQEQDGVEGNPLDDANHVVRLVGIDTTRGLAYLSDPGRADGQNLAVPLEMLKDAWNDSGNKLIVSDVVDPTPDQAGTPPTPTSTPTAETPEIAEVPARDIEPVPATPEQPSADQAPAPAARPDAPAPASAPAQPAAARPAVVPASAPAATPAEVAPLDLGISDTIDAMLQTAADAPEAPAVDLTTPASQPDGLFDSALGFVLVPVAVSAGIAGTLGYKTLRSNN